MKNTYLFFVLALCTLLIGVLSNYILGADTLVVQSLAEQLTQEQIQDALHFKDKWQWIGYIVAPLILLLKIAIIAAIIDIGCFFFDKEVKYKTLFTIVLKAEFIFLIVIVFKTVWFYVFQQDYSLEDLQFFYPLSAINIVGYEGLQTWFIYPLQTINIFEIAYWFILAYLLGKELKQSTEKSFGIVASSYGVGLAIWVVAIMFLNLNMG